MKAKYLIIFISIIAAAAATCGVLVLANHAQNKTDNTAKNTTPQETTTPPSSDDTHRYVAALQMAQKDTQVKNDLSIITSAINNYRSNNRGALPTTASDLTSLTTSYLKDNLLGTHPVTGQAYQIVMTTGAATDVYYQRGFVCSSDGKSVVKGTVRQFALTTTLPTGVLYCTGI